MLGQMNIGDIIGKVKSAYEPSGLGGGHSHIYAIKVCAAVKGRVFKQFALGKGIEIEEFWSRTGYNLQGNQSSL